MDENNEISEKTIKKYEFYAKILMLLAIIMDILVSVCLMFSFIVSVHYI